MNLTYFRWPLIFNPFSICFGHGNYLHVYYMDIHGSQRIDIQFLSDVSYRSVNLGNLLSIFSFYRSSKLSLHSWFQEDLDRLLRYLMN